MNDRKIADFVPLANSRQQFAQINQFSVAGSKGTAMDDLWGVGYVQSGREHHPFSVQTVLDDNFEKEPSMEGRTEALYDDSTWGEARLPKVHGSERFAGEDLYLRKSVHVADFKRAFLNVETLDPEAEIWINERAPISTLNMKSLSDLPLNRDLDTSPTFPVSQEEQRPAVPALPQIQP